MINVAKPHHSHEIFSLWQAVLSDLIDVFDLQLVSSTFSNQIARHLGCRVLVAVADGETNFYNIWITDPQGPTHQDRWSKDEAGIDLHLTYKQPTRLDKLERSASEVISGRLWLETRRKLIVAPLSEVDRSYAPHPPALLALIDPPEEDAIDLETTAKIADLMRVFLDRAALRQLTDRQSVEFAVISDVSQALSSTLNVQEIYQLLRGPIRQALNVETLSIGLVEPITGDIIFVEDLMGPMFERLPTIRLKRGLGIAGWVAEHQEPVTINNAYSDQRFFSDVDRSSGFRTQSMICIPLKVDKRTIGVLQAINRQFGRFTDHDLKLIEGLGGPLAAAIENANLNANVLVQTQRARTLLASIDEGLVLVNRDGFITQANTAYALLVNGEENEIVGSPINDRIRFGEGDIRDLIARVANSEGDIQLAAEIGRTDGRVIPVLISGAPIETEGKIAEEIILILSDLTQVQELERMRDDLFQGIIHELRTPLATILMYARLLREGKTRQTDKAERFLGVIERESDRLQRMIRQILDLAKFESREIRRSPVPIMLNPIFNIILPPMAERAVQKGLLFRQRIETDLPAVMGNIEIYEQVLHNLLDNAVKFTPSGSVQVSARQEDAIVIIDVSDEGIGIPPEAMNHLFKQFYRTQTAVERGLAGTGLGLYMVKESLRIYNGRVNVQSTLGKGSVFTVQLPIAKI